MLQPNEQLKKLQDEGNFTKIMFLNEEMKTMPFGDVWKEYLKREKVVDNYYKEVENYEKEVLLNR